MTDTKPKANRRNFLKIMGGGLILAAGAGTLFATTRTPTKAIEPWRLALGPEVRNATAEDPRRIVLSHAILAPNPHNRQPWVVDLGTPDEMVLFCDLDKRLPHTDPFDRQITIGLGCFLELAEMTARQIGMRADITVFPQGESFPRLDARPVARIRLSKDQKVKPDPLFAYILERRSNKDPFDTSKTVNEMDAANIVQASHKDVTTGSVVAKDAVENLRKITWDALFAEMHTYEANKESIDLMRMGKAEINASPDGIDMGGVFLETLSMLGQLNREDLINQESSAFKNGIPIVLEPLGSAMGYVFIKTNGNARSDQIAAGRSYVRMNLKSTELGIAIHPLSQALQEYDEVAKYNRQINQALGTGAEETLQMFSRIGYGKKPNPSPRWHYEAKIRSG